MGQGLSLAVLGATGSRGENLLQLLARRNFPYGRLLPLDDDALLGKYVEIGDKRLPLISYRDFSFEDVDLALVCQPVDAEVINLIREQGCTLVAPAEMLPDSGFDPVVADVNLRQLPLEKGMQLPIPSAFDSLLAGLLSPLHDQLGLVAANVVWTRSVSADGRQAIEGLAGETAQLLNGNRPKAGVYPQPIAFNLMALDSSADQARFLSLWQALWGDSLRLSISTLVAPLFFGDMLSLFIETEQAASLAEFREILGELPDCQVTAASRDVLLSAADSATGDKINLAEPRGSEEQGHHFSLNASMDGQRLGLAMNLLKIAEHLEKNLFISYS